MRKVFVDTSVLFPFSVMDLFLALTEDGVHQVLWTEELLAEWERVIVREHHRTPETAASVTAAIREFFADCRIEPVRYAGLVAQMPGRDPDDHPHIAAAVAAQVDALITANVADFPVRSLAALGVRVLVPDAYLVELFDKMPEEVLSTVLRIAGEKTRPPMTPTDILNALRGAGLHEFPQLVEAWL